MVYYIKGNWEECLAPASKLILLFKDDTGDNATEIFTTCQSPRKVYKRKIEFEFTDYGIMAKEVWSELIYP